MLNINFEIPVNFDLSLLKEKLMGLPVEIEEMPGTCPRIVTATAEHPEHFYQLGGIMAVELLLFTTNNTSNVS